MLASFLSFTFRNYDPVTPEAYFAEMVKPHTHVDELFLAGLACVLNSDLVIIYLHPRPGLPECKIIVASPDFKHDDGKRGANLPIFRFIISCLIAVNTCQRFLFFEYFSNVIFQSQKS